MGDRANVVVVDRDWPSEDRRDALFIFTQWRGEELPEIVRQALLSNAAQQRLGDGPYLSRILFERVIADACDKETGYGVWHGPRDNSAGRPLLVFEVRARKLFAVDEAAWEKDGFTPEVLAQSPSISVVDYVKCERWWDNLTTVV